MIRNFKKSDLDAILAIEKDSFPKLPYNWVTFLYYATVYPDNFLVYWCDETGKSVHKIVGYIIFYPQGHIVSIAVHSEYRRRGIGTELVKAVLRRTHGRASVEVRESNEVAKRFYTHLGFSQETRLSRYYGDEDAIVMVRKK